MLQTSSSLDLSKFTPTEVVIPENATQAEWTELHRVVLLCKKASTKWLQQSRGFAAAKWGMDFVNDTEVQLELDLGIALLDQPPEPDSGDKTRAMGAVQGIAKKFQHWQSKMSDEFTEWNPEQLRQAIELLEPIESQVRHLRELLASR
ncbi:MAG: hypothetical protein ACOVLK_00285 [Terrimicrobiaceae bacterium]|jgi:hypothetical protein